MAKSKQPPVIKYPEEPFESFYFRFKTVREMQASPEWAEIYNNFYEMTLDELDLKIGETKHELNELSPAEQRKEIEKCVNNFFYWCHRYVKILHPKYGTIPFICYKYQRRVIEEYESKRYNMISKFRQGGLTTVAVLWGLWKCLFQVDQQIYVLSKTDREAKSAGDIATRAMENFPSWMFDSKKAELSKHEKKFNDSESKICFYTPEAARGKTATNIIIDEAAFIPNMHEHWKSMYPVIAAGGSIEIISTVNGLGNWYEETYHEAEAGLNFFNIIDLDYWEHPAYSNPKWVAETKANLGEKSWQQEILRSFLGSGETYISTTIIGQIDRFVKNHQPARTAFDKWTNDEINKLNWERGAIYIWKEPIDGHEYVIGADCAEGVGKDGDNSCFQIIDASTMEQVAEFYSNTVPPNVFSQILNQIGIYYKNATVAVENNSIGSAVLSVLMTDLAYEALYYEKPNRPGVKIGPGNRSAYLEALQNRLMNGQLRINSKRFVHELKTFIYSAQKRRAEAMKGKHDDAIMAMSIALRVRDEQMRGVPVGGEIPEDMVRIFKTETYEEIKREILEGGVADWMSSAQDYDPLYSPSEVLVPTFFKRKNDKLLREFGW